MEGIQSTEPRTQKMGKLGSLVGDGEAAGNLATAGSCRYHLRDTEGYKEESDIVRGQGIQAGLEAIRGDTAIAKKNTPKHKREDETD